MKASLWLSQSRFAARPREAGVGHVRICQRQTAAVPHSNVERGAWGHHVGVGLALPKKGAASSAPTEAHGPPHEDAIDAINLIVRYNVVYDKGK